MPMIDRHCSTYHRTLGSVQFQFHSSLAWAPAYSLPCTLLETFVDQKLYLYQLISRMVKYYQDWIFSVIIIINIHENDRFQWSLYLYLKSSGLFQRSGTDFIGPISDAIRVRLNFKVRSGVRIGSDGVRFESSGGGPVWSPLRSGTDLNRSAAGSKRTDVQP